MAVASRTAAAAVGANFLTLAPSLAVAVRFPRGATRRLCPDFAVRLALLSLASIAFSSWSWGVGCRTAKAISSRSTTGRKGRLVERRGKSGSGVRKIGALSLNPLKSDRQCVNIGHCSEFLWGSTLGSSVCGTLAVLLRHATAYHCTPGPQLGTLILGLAIS
ncbi:hypothetical protein HaLaN_22837 [Haematococcus lacustris]|uniref:Uncharacterized protein n=1 Tax=Haematococcus lacustris TaxID=44745 RepID=A0A699ZSQ3_HAELA|nr:hypothetical protein HaLaN_22837 [Haematococcus lacustris]